MTIRAVVFVSKLFRFIIWIPALFLVFSVISGLGFFYYLLVLTLFFYATDKFNKFYFAGLEVISKQFLIKSMLLLLVQFLFLFILF